MPSLIIIIGICLTAATAERPAERDAGPYWPNTPSEAPTAKPKVVEYAAGNGSTVRTTEAAPPARPAGIAEFAPDPPRALHNDATPALFQQDIDAPPIHLAAAESPAGTESPARDRKREMAAEISAQGSPSNLRPSTIATPATATLPVSPTNSAEPLTLGGRADKGSPGKSSPLGAMFTVGGSLSIVLGLFLVIAWAMRKTAPRGSLMLPKEVFEILGRAPLGARQQVQLLRCGSKLLLVSITPHGTETLTEVTDPLEVDRIAGICQQGNPKSSTVAFRQVFQQLATKPAAAETENLDMGGLRRKRYRWEEKHA